MYTFEDAPNSSVETQLYWVSSRYYNPEWGRFIESDTLDYIEPNSINGLNLYAYCGNDPVNYYDPSGHFAISALIIGAIIGAAIGFGTAAYIDYQDDGQIFNGSVKWYDYLGATVLGGAIGAGLGAFASMSFSATLPTGFAFIETSIGTTVLVATGTTTLTVTGAQILGAVGLLGATYMFASQWKSGGYRVKKFPDDYDPTLVHIYGDDISDKYHGIRIGLDGNPLPGEDKLPPGARKALKRLWEQILKALLK